MRTSVAHTFFVNAEFDRAIEEDRDDPPFVTLHALLSTGRRDEAHAVCQRMKESGLTHLRPELSAVRAVIDGRHADGAAAMQGALSRRSFKDPEGFFYWALTLMLLGDRPAALDLLQRAVAGGLNCPRAFELNPLLDPLRGHTAFSDMLTRVRAAHDEAATAFHAAGGRRLLGLP